MPRSKPQPSTPSEGTPRPTIRDVARMAGVGTMTVSRVVNRSGYVSEKTREAVEAAIAELGYLPNQHARGLRSRRSGTIALLVTDITNPFFTTLARGAEDATRLGRRLVLLGNTDEDEAAEIAYMELLISKGVDGVLLVPARRGEAAIELARRHEIPVVLVDREGPIELDSVRCDAGNGAFDLTHHLLTLGHRRIAVLAGSPEAFTTRERIEGIRRACGSLPVELTIHHGPLSVASGVKLAQEALRTAEPPTAIFALNNFLTLGALQGLKEARLKVPDEISLAGFDDLPTHLLSNPFLTVVVQPAYEMGRKAAERLLLRIDQPLLPPEILMLPTHLEFRKSTAQLKR